MKYVHFGIVQDGKKWHGDWSVEGDELIVRSAYTPARRVPLRRAKPELKAARVLKEMVEAWRGK